MSWADDARAAIAAGEAEVEEWKGTAETVSLVAADLQKQLDECRNPTPPGPVLRYEYTDFRTAPQKVMGGAGQDASKANTTLDPDGLLVMKCDGTQGAAVMFEERHPTGYWEVECYFLKGSESNSSTKICLLLWPETSWSQTHHEIDFNESGLRSESHQTIHDENAAGSHVMKQTSYLVNQYAKHVYGVRKEVGSVSYYLDGILMGEVLPGPNIFIPQDNWNLHIRTIPKGSTDKTTLIVTRVKATE